MKRAVNWIQVESETVVKGDASFTTDHDIAVHQARSVDFDFRKAEALCLIAPADALQVLRVQISRGQMKRAATTITEAFAIRPDLSNDPEWSLEAARIHGFFHEWPEAVSRLDHVLKTTPSPVTRMTALQSRAYMFYESGRFCEALADIDQICSLARLYPRSQSAFYSKVLAVKISSLNGEFKKACAELALLWETSPLNADAVLTLLRLEGHVLRTLHREADAALWASSLLAEQMGDDLYSALARFEIWGGRPPTEEDQRIFRRDLIAHPKIQRLSEDLVLDDPRCTTTRFLKSQTPGRLLASATSLLIPSRALIIQLSPFTVTRVKRWTQPLESLAHVARRDRMTKAELFGLLFDGQKFAPSLHNTVLHQILSRARKMTGLQIHVEESFVLTNSVLVVETA